MQKTMKLLVVALVVMIAIAVLVLLMNKSPNTSSRPSATPTPQEQVVGGDKDEHGCLGSAGYSWCETKAKCLRIWEEKCPAI